MMAQAARRGAFPIEPPLDEWIEERAKSGMGQGGAKKQETPGFSLDGAKKGVLDSFSKTVKNADAAQKEMVKAFERKPLGEKIAKESMLDYAWVQLKGRASTGNFLGAPTVQEAAYFVSHWKEAAPKYAALFDSYGELGQQYAQFRKSYSSLETAANSQCTMEEFANAFRGASDAYVRYQFALVDFGVKLEEHKLTWFDAFERALDVAMIASVMSGIGGLAAGGARAAGAITWQAIKSGAKKFAKEQSAGILIGSAFFTAIEACGRELVDERLREFFKDPLDAITRLSSELKNMENRLGKGELAETARKARTQLEELGEHVRNAKTHLELGEAAVVFLQNVAVFSVFALGFKAARFGKAEAGAGKVKKQGGVKTEMSELEIKQELEWKIEKTRLEEWKIEKGKINEKSAGEERIYSKVDKKILGWLDAEETFHKVSVECFSCIVENRKISGAEKLLLKNKIGGKEREIVNGLAKTYGLEANSADLMLACDFANKQGVSRNWFYNMFAKMTEGNAQVGKMEFEKALHEVLGIAVLEAKHPKEYGLLLGAIKDAGYQQTPKNIASLYRQMQIAMEGDVPPNAMADEMARQFKAGKKAATIEEQARNARSKIIADAENYSKMEKIGQTGDAGKFELPPIRETFPEHPKGTHEHALVKNAGELWEYRNGHHKAWGGKGGMSDEAVKILTHMEDSAELRKHIEMLGPQSLLVGELHQAIEFSGKRGVERERFLEIFADVSEELASNYPKVPKEVAEKALEKSVSLSILEATHPETFGMIKESVKKAGFATSPANLSSMEGYMLDALKDGIKLPELIESVKGIMPLLEFFQSSMFANTITSNDLMGIAIRLARLGYIQPWQLKQMKAALADIGAAPEQNLEALVWINNFLKPNDPPLHEVLADFAKGHGKNWTTVGDYLDDGHFENFVEAYRQKYDRIPGRIGNN